MHKLPLVTQTGEAGMEASQATSLRNSQSLNKPVKYPGDSSPFCLWLVKMCWLNPKTYILYLFYWLCLCFSNLAGYFFQGVGGESLGQLFMFEIPK